MTTVNFPSQPMGGPVRKGVTGQTEMISLLRVTDTIARNVVLLEPEPATFVLNARSTRPRMLLFLLSYCYARQILSSRAIERLVLTDAILRRCCGDETPAADELRRFRSENRVMLQTCLHSALRELAEHNPALGGISKLDPAQFEREANRRMVSAAFMDSLELGPDSPDLGAELGYLFAKERSAMH